MNDLVIDRRPAANIAIAKLISEINSDGCGITEMAEAISGIIAACGFNDHNGSLSSLMLESPGNYGDLIDFATHYNLDD